MAEAGKINHRISKYLEKVEKEDALIIQPFCVEVQQIDSLLHMDRDTVFSFHSPEFWLK